MGILTLVKKHQFKQKQKRQAKLKSFSSATENEEKNFSPETGYDYPNVNEATLRVGDIENLKHLTQIHKELSNDEVDSTVLSINSLSDDMEGEDTISLPNGVILKRIKSQKKGKGKTKNTESFQDEKDSNTLKCSSEKKKKHRRHFRRFIPSCFSSIFRNKYKEAIQRTTTVKNEKKKKDQAFLSTESELANQDTLLPNPTPAPIGSILRNGYDTLGKNRSITLKDTDTHRRVHASTYNTISSTTSTSSMKPIKLIRFDTNDTVTNSSLNAMGDETSNGRKSLDRYRHSDTATHKPRSTHSGSRLLHFDTNETYVEDGTALNEEMNSNAGSSSSNSRPNAAICFAQYFLHQKGNNATANVSPSLLKAIRAVSGMTPLCPKKKVEEEEEKKETERFAFSSVEKIFEEDSGEKHTTGKKEKNIEKEEEEEEEVLDEEEEEEVLDEDLYHSQGSTPTSHAIAIPKGWVDCDPEKTVQVSSSAGTSHDYRFMMESQNQLELDPKSERSIWNKLKFTPTSQLEKNMDEDEEEHRFYMEMNQATVSSVSTFDSVATVGTLDSVLSTHSVDTVNTLTMHSNSIASFEMDREEDEEEKKIKEEKVAAIKKIKFSKNLKKKMKLIKKKSSSKANAQSTPPPPLLPTRQPVIFLNRHPDTEPVLDQELAEILRPSLPYLVQEATHWRLLFSLDQHGASLSSLYRQSNRQDVNNVDEGNRKISCIGDEGYKERNYNLFDNLSSNNQACLLVLRSAENEVFGAYTTEPFAPFDPKNGQQRGFYGSPECFLWKMEHLDEKEEERKEEEEEKVEEDHQKKQKVFEKKKVNSNCVSTLPNKEQLSLTNGLTKSNSSSIYANYHLKKFISTHKNQYFMLADQTFIAMGGGNGNFGFYLDDDIQFGYSATCDTYDNELLTTDNEFECHGLEIWGFEYH